jgi:hypothetical protein
MNLTQGKPSLQKSLIAQILSATFVVCLATLFVSLPALAISNSLFRVNNGRSQIIYQSPSCQTVTNASGRDIMVPIKTSGEWSGGTYNFLVNWGDGSVDTITAWNAAAATHTYSVAGTYTIALVGVYSQLQFNNTGDKLKITDVTQMGQQPMVQHEQYV